MVRGSSRFLTAGVCICWTLTGFVLPVASARATQPAQDVPVMIHASVSDSDYACGTSAEVANLDPAGDNFLSVQSGPGGKPYRELDRLQPKKEVWICDEKGPWLGVVYANSHEDCGNGQLVKKTHAYAGPCKSGWIYRRYTRVLAG